MAPRDQIIPTADGAAAPMPETAKPASEISVELAKKDFPLGYTKAQPVKEVDAYYKNPLRISQYSVHGAAEGLFKRSARKIAKIGLVVGLASGWWVYRLQTSEEGEMVSTSNQRYLLRSLPSRKASRLFGAVSEMQASRHIIKTYAFLTGANLDEAVNSNTADYKTLQEFFTRNIKPETRPISDCALVSPCDGTILRTGEAYTDDNTTWINQIKGYRYEVEDLLRYRAAPPSPGKKRVFAVIWLSPGDYHRFHVPADSWAVSCVNHIYGALLPVHALAYKFIDELPCLNERMSINGKWAHGQLSVVPVGAYNVGSIKLDLISRCCTNASDDDALATEALVSKHQRTTTFTMPVHAGKKGSEMGRFELGSTIVMVVDIPADQDLIVATGDTVKMGAALMSAV